MKVLFVLLQLSDDLSSGGMYLDLIEEFRDHGHDVTIVAPCNKGRKSGVSCDCGFRILRVESLPTQDVRNMIKKGVALAMLPLYYKKAYEKHLIEEKFDWIFMPTPPITLSSFIRFIKRRSGAGFYLILRDIHPQSAWSIGLIKYRWMFRYLDRKARIGYNAADVIGCMSKANISYVENLYPGLKIGRLELLYNWQKYAERSDLNDEVREKYGLSGKILALFGGTIGMGQRVENIVSLASHSRNNKNLVFVIIGKGVAKDRLSRLVSENNLNNVLILDFMPRNDYLSFVNSVDIGLISINENYKVPTCPSKAVSYMALGIPIFAMINEGNDYGSIIENDAGAGYCTEGGNSIDFEKFDRMVADEELRLRMGANGYLFYKQYLTSEVAYNSIMRQISE